MEQKKQKTSILERLRMAYKALTCDYYVFFGFNKNTILLNNDKTYKEINKKKLSMFSYIPYDNKIIAYGKETNTHDCLWHGIEKIAKDAQKGNF